jgi:NAD(P)-dependent dehydrogenase (short-subunit alcohol dehydrogenase family)
MDVNGKVVVVTGAAQGIGRALAEEFAAQGARKVVLADLHLDKVQAAAAPIGGLAVQCDVSREDSIRALVETAQAEVGPIDVFFCNAGIIGPEGGLDLEDAVWDAMWKIHTMAHVWAARAVVPSMIARGGGYFCSTASAAGVLALMESPAYSVTKHAAVAFAEWLSITHHDKGLRVSCLCPQAVDTAMIANGGGSAGVDGVLSPQTVAKHVLEAMKEERFFVFPHPTVEQYMAVRGSQHPRWLAGMRRGFAKLTKA